MYNSKAYELLIPLVKGADAGIKKEQLFKKSKEFHDKALNFKLLAYYPNKISAFTLYFPFLLLPLQSTALSPEPAHCPRQTIPDGHQLPFHNK